MKGMLKIMIFLALVFASTFLLLNVTGVLTIDRITYWFEFAKKSSPVLIGCVVTFLLFADLFVAIPTLTVMILSGFFLGPAVGTMFSIVGLTLAGVTGYAMSCRYGDKLAKRLIKDENELRKSIQTFDQYGTGTILLSRAVPILPEVSACMAGLTKMPRVRFFMLWMISTIPYAVIANYAGSISSETNPKPAILTAVSLTAFLWLAWLLYRYFVINKNA